MIKVFGYSIPYPLRLPVWVDITRPFMSVLAGLTAYLSANLVTQSSPDRNSQNLLLAGSIFFLFASSMVINDYLDYEEDRINDPKKAIPSGKISRNAALLYGIGLFLAGLLLSAFLSWPMVLYGGIFLLCNISYSLWLKKRILVGNFYTGLYSSYAILAVAIYTGRYLELAYFFLYATVFIFGREILRTASDAEGDQQAGIASVANRHGAKMAATSGLVLMIASVVCYILELARRGSANPILAGAVGLAFLILLGMGGVLLRSITKTKVRWLADYSSLVMLLMVFAFTSR